MEEQFLRCPQCKSANLYVESDGSMVFFKINSDGKPAFANPEIKPENIDLSKIYCTACAWYGGINELDH